MDIHSLINIHSDCQQYISGGTLYQASILINDKKNGSHKIYIVDGQSQSQLSYYFANNASQYHPCLPVPFTINGSVTITFDSNAIQSFDSWYPLGICQNVSTNSIMYLKKYMLDAQSNLIVKNLIIESYQFSLLSIIRTKDYTASAMCNHCSFINISSSNQETLFQAKFAINFWNTQFLNVNTTSQTIMEIAEHVYQPSFNLGRKFILNNTIFSNIVADEILTITPSDQDVKFASFTCRKTNAR